jgi:hypothetical protein
MTPFAAALATTVVAVAAPAAASAAELDADPALACYREEQTVFLPGTGFTPNAEINFTRDGMSVPASPPIVADGAGNLNPTLRLPGLISGERRFVYRATDSLNPALFAEVPLRVTSTHVRVRPRQGRPSRLLRITARGFFGGRTLWAHVKRSGSAGRTRHVRIGRVRGACNETRARRRLFPPGAASGSYRVQFDTHRRYRRSRAIKYEFIITIFRDVRG